MIRFENSYVSALPGAYLRLNPAVPPEPRLLAWNDALARDLGLQISEAEAAVWFSGAVVPDGAEPVALAYAGHQFG